MADVLESLRVRVLLLLCAIFVLVVAGATYQASERRDSDLAYAVARLQDHADLIAAKQSDVFQDTEQIMSLLLETPDLSKLAQEGRCQRMFAAFVKGNPGIDNLLIAAPSGDVICNAAQLQGSINLSDRMHFQKALVTPGIVVEQALISRSTGKWVVPFAGAIRNEANKVQGVLVAAVDLEWINEEFHRAKYPADARLGLIDSKGTILARYPDPEQLIGTNVAERPFFKTIESQGGTGIAELTTYDNVRRIFAFSHFAETVVGPIYLWVGLSKASVTANSDYQFALTVGIALGLVAALCAFVWFAGESYLIGPISAIADAARRLSLGDYQARTGLRYAKNEIGELARAFDHMALALMSKAEILRLNRALRVLSACGKNLVHAGSEDQLLAENCRAIVEVGGYRMAWVGFAERNAEKTVRPVAQYGYEEGYVAAAHITWADAERGRGPTGMSIRTGVSQINRDIFTNPAMAPWRQDAVSHGYQSSVALPLKDRSGVFGSLMIYAAEPDAFQGDEVRLLEELAEDLAFGVTSHRSNLERQQAEAKAERLANFDTLTDLPNRVQLIDHLDKAIERAGARGELLALMIVSVDRYNEIQDGIGIAGADDLLKQLALRLSDAAGEVYFVARIAGESFAIIVPLADDKHAAELAARFQAVTVVPLEYAGIPIDVQTTAGAAFFPHHGDDADSLVRRADIAVRQARVAGTDYAAYSGKSETESPQQLILLSDLRKAIRNDGLVLYYQPKIAARSAEISGVEALVRWSNGGRGMVPPNQFIPLAERTGLIKPITHWVLGAALKQIVDWQQLGIFIPIAVNVSPNNLRDPDFLNQLVALHQRFPAKRDLLDFEITETALMVDPSKARELLLRVTDLGIRVFIDDFGTGYSSLSYLATLPIHALKIDRSFVINMIQQPRYQAIVVSTISLAHSLGIKVVAEGIETVDQANALKHQGCDEMQGYLFSKPLPADEFLRWHSSERPDSPWAGSC